LPPLPEPRLQQASLLALFKLLRPDLPSSTVLLLADVARAHAPAQQASALAEGPAAVFFPKIATKPTKAMNKLANSLSNE
jgi:hypothetical protein